MRVVVRLFASYREAAGVGRIELELPAGAKVKDAIFSILKDHPLIAEGRQVVIARNQEYVTADEPLADGDEIAQRLEADHAPLRLVMHHRVGDLGIGEIAVIVAAGAPHRDAAFAAARAAIDELKTIVPIWKKEFSDDGAVWVEDHA